MVLKELIVQFGNSNRICTEQDEENNQIYILKVDVHIHSPTKITRTE